MAKKAKITHVKAPKIPKFKTYKPKKVTIKIKSGVKTQKPAKVGQRTFKSNSATKGIAKATKNIGSTTPQTPRPSRLMLNN